MEEDLNFTHYVLWEPLEGEEHIPQLLHNESGLVDNNNSNPATDSRVAGRLKGRHQVYEDLGADQYIIEVVKNGYKLVFDEIPPKSFTRNNKSALSMDFVYDELMNCPFFGYTTNFSGEK